MYAGKVTSKPVAKKKKHPGIQDKDLAPQIYEFVKANYEAIKIYRHAQHSDVSRDKELLPLLISARSAINFPEKTQNKVIFNLLKSHFKTLHNYRV